VFTKLARTALAASILVLLATPAVAATKGPVVPSLGPAPTTSAQPTSTLASIPGVDVTTDIIETLNKDGTLSISENLVAPDNKTITRTVPLRFAIEAGQDRIFTISSAKVTSGAGSTSTSADQFHVTVTGTATVEYKVSGAVVTVGDHEEVRWQPVSGWDTGFSKVVVSFRSPAVPSKIQCLAGLYGSTLTCTNLDVTNTGSVFLQENNLPSGHRIDLSVNLPANTVPPNLTLATESQLSKSFALDTNSGTLLLMLAVILLVGVFLLWFLRGRDAKIPSAEITEAHLLVTEPNGAVSFASPEGVLPGQVGVVVDEYVDPRDMSATVLDLAVRNYLYIAADQTGYWLVRRHHADESLTAYEKAIYELVLPGDVDHVQLADLAPEKSARKQVVATMYAEVTDNGWFKRRPDRDRRNWLIRGLVLLVLGIVGTAVLALTVGHALLALSLVIGGLGLAFMAKHMPSRTVQGGQLASHIVGLKKYLATVDASQLPPQDAELIFSRSLPYAVALDTHKQWLKSFVTLDTTADGDAGLYWFTQENPDFAAFEQEFGRFLGKLEAALS
jgi:hypothetical protein